MLKILLMLAIIYWIAEKLEIIRQSNKRKRIAAAKAESKRQEQLKRERVKAELLAARQAEKEAREAVRAEKELAKLEKAQKAENTRKAVASSNRQFIDHRQRQLEQLIEIYEDAQSGTIYGGKEWIKYQSKILSLENQLQALQTKNIKFRAVTMQ